MAEGDSVRRRIDTERLILRPFVADDAPSVARLANDPEVSRYTKQIVYPYSVVDAAKWIDGHPGAEADGKGRPWAIVGRTADLLFGAISLEMHPEDRLGVLGYWLGRPFWRQGYGTEAAKAVIAWGFAHGLAKIAATTFADNTASGALLQRCGLHCEGVLRSHIERRGRRHDVCCFGCLSDP